MTTAPGLPLEEGDGAALVARGAAVVSRGELRRLSDELSERLRREGIERAMVVSDDPVDVLRAIDACARAGADLWIAHTNLSGAMLEDLSTEFGVQLRIGARDEVLAGAGPGIDARGPGAGLAGAGLAGAEQAGHGRASFDGPRARVFMMTSGTTGRPKVAAHTLGSLLAKVRTSVSVSANREGRWLLTYQPTGFAGVQVMLTATLSHGLIVVPEERTPQGFFEAARRWEVGQISGTPTFWRSFLMATPPGAIELRQITLGGEAVDQATLDRLKARFPAARITHIYASTEAGVVFAVHDGLEGFPKGWLEQPVQGVELRLQDDLLQIKTPNAMQGYLTEAAQPLLEGGWVATADRCEIIGDRVRILGRQDSTINVGGSKVYPLAIEGFLLSLPGVVEAKVYGVPNPISGALVGADVVLGPGSEPSEAKKAILARCRAELATYQVPRVFRVVDAIQVGTSGKKG